jgi:hypothetical protein
MPQFRTTRRLEGEYVLGPGDAHRSFADSIGCVGDWRQAGPVYEIPYRALYSSKVANVFAAGRNISSAGDTWEVTRVIPPAAATGQAAGTAAALISASGGAAGAVDVPRLQQILAEGGVLIHKAWILREKYCYVFYKFTRPHKLYRGVLIMDINNLVAKAREIRKDIIEIAYKAQAASHPAPAFLCADILVALYFKIMKIDPTNPRWEERDRFILSKGNVIAWHCGIPTQEQYEQALEELSN